MDTLVAATTGPVLVGGAMGEEAHPQVQPVGLFADPLGQR